MFSLCAEIVIVQTFTLILCSEVAPRGFLIHETSYIYIFFFAL